MQKKWSKKEINNSKKESNIFKDLMQNEKFIQEILNTKCGVEIIKKFDSRGVDLNKIDFVDLCGILAQINLDNSKSIKVTSIDSPWLVDYHTLKDKTTVVFED